MRGAAMRLLLLAFGLACVILFTIMTISIVKDTKKRKTYRECTGRIEKIKVRKQKGSASAKSYLTPLISYAVNGQTYQYAGTYATGKMEVGQEIQLLYDPEHPEKACSKKGLYYVAFVTGLVGVIFTAVLVMMSVIVYTHGL